MALASYSSSFPQKAALFNNKMHANILINKGLPTPRAVGSKIQPVRPIKTKCYSYILNQMWLVCIPSNIITS